MGVERGTYNAGDGGSMPSSLTRWNTKTKGDISEAAVLLALLQTGCIVSVCWGDNARYDLIVDIDGTLNRVQVKTGRVRDGCVLFRCSSVNVRTGITSCYKGQVEYFGVFVPELNSCYLVPIDHANETEMSFRIEPTKNNQDAYAKWAEDYKITNITRLKHHIRTT